MRTVDVLIAIILVLGILGMVLPAAHVSAQGPTYGSVGSGPIAPTIKDCPLSGPNGFAFCAYGTAAPYSICLSVASGPCLPFPTPSGAGGVSSWNAATGAVTYQPTTVTCAKFTAAKGVFSGSNCVVK
jgi:hypothetical protein